VVGLGRRHLLEYGNRELQQLPKELRDAFEWRHRLDVLLESGWGELAQAVMETGIRTAGIKGAAMRSLYAHATDRDAGDIDIMVENVDEAWRLASWLRRRGYDWCEYEWP